MYRFFFKRVLDIIISGLVLIVCFPVFLLLFVIVKLDSPGPFFFFQERLGYKALNFKVFKIRTMTHKNRLVHQEILENNPEVTRIGKILRRLKIDELPQVINVFMGDMSIVGPRPGLPTQLAELNDDGKKRLSVRPGLTGLAQVNGNIYLTWPERWKYDRSYAEKLSLVLDVKIMLKTVSIVLRGEEKFIKKPEEND